MMKSFSLKVSNHLTKYPVERSLAARNLRALWSITIVNGRPTREDLKTLQASTTAKSYFSITVQRLSLGNSFVNE